MKKKGDLSDFDSGLAVSARWDGLNISDSADLLGFHCTTNSKGYRVWTEYSNTTLTQLTTWYTKGSRRAYLNAQHIEP